MLGNIKISWLLDVHRLQRMGIYRFSRTRINFCSLLVLQLFSNSLFTIENSFRDVTETTTENNQNKIMIEQIMLET